MACKQCKPKIVREGSSASLSPDEAALRGQLMRLKLQIDTLGSMLSGLGGTFNGLIAQYNDLVYLLDRQAAERLEKEGENEKNGSRKAA
jgi:hypothetical protein